LARETSSSPVIGHKLLQPFTFFAKGRKRLVDGIHIALLAHSFSKASVVSVPDSVFSSPMSDPPYSQISICFGSPHVHNLYCITNGQGCCLPVFLINQTAFPSEQSQRRFWISQTVSGLHCDHNRSPCPVEPWYACR